MPKSKKSPKEEKKTEVEEPQVEETTADETVEETPAEETTAEAAPADAPAQEADPAKQVSDNPDFMKRLSKVEQTVIEKKETNKEADLSKVVDMGFSKVATALESFEKRLETLESQPATPKTKPSYMLTKSFDGGTPESTKSPEATARLEKVNARLGELGEIAKSQPGVYQHKHQAEAMSLLDEKSRLERA